MHLRSTAHRGIWTRIVVVIAVVVLAGCGFFGSHQLDHHSKHR